MLGKMNQNTCFHMSILPKFPTFACGMILEEPQ